MRKFCLTSLFLIFAPCHSQEQILEELTSTENDLLQPVFSNPENYEVQIIYSQIDRQKNGEVVFRDYSYRLDPETYFYPASTVKLPVAVLALEKLNELRENNPGLNRHTPYVIKGDIKAYSIEKDIAAIFAVSDNEAYNRLFEFLGQDYINERLKEKGLAPVRISHRLSAPNSDVTKTKPLQFSISEGASLKKLDLPGTVNKKIDSLQLKAIGKGKGYMENDSLIEKPFNFSLKNYFPLQVQHQLMKQLMFPGSFDKNKNFQISKEDREFLLRAMSQFPREAGYKEHQDSYVKFFMFGDSKDPVSEEIKIFNKVGYAYGTLTETAYIKDENRNVEFLLSATLLVNKNRVFNDNIYEFESIGIPFLAALGREIYELELNRKNN